MSTSYNDGNVPFGGFTVTLYRGTSALGTYILETFTPSRPTKKVERSDQFGGPNGFALVNAQESANGVLQIAITSTPFPQRGDFFTLSSDPTIGNEKWVIESISQPFEAGTYYKSTVQLMKTYLS